MQLRNLTVLGVAALATSMALAGTASASPSKEENIGIGTGVVVGAVAGGPVGAIVGAAIGAKLGDAFHNKDERVARLGHELDGRQKNVDRLAKRVKELSAENDALDSDLRKLKAMARPELLSLLQAGIEMDLLFRTDEHVLLDGTGERVRDIARTLASMPDVHVKIDGYSDERGDAEYNRELSQRRAEHVRDVLVSSGLKASRIRLDAHGESPAVDASPDSYALERKVSLTLFVADSPSLAKSN